MEEKLQAIRESVVGAVHRAAEDRMCPLCNREYWEAPITLRLADVLLAIERFRRTPRNFVRGTDAIGILVLPTQFNDRSWNLHTDDLSQQSPATIDFLYEMLKADT